MKKQLMFAVSGYKNSGKTKMITSVIPLLTAKGFKVAVIKHDGHDFEGDVKGTDSFCHKQAGAYATAVFSKNRVLIHKDCDDADETIIKKAFPEADIILLEGFKESSYPKYFCTYPERENVPAYMLAEMIIEEYERITEDS